MMKIGEGDRENEIEGRRNLGEEAIQGLRYLSASLHIFPS
jgi:hypothetical protein